MQNSTFDVVRDRAIIHSDSGSTDKVYSSVRDVVYSVLSVFHDLAICHCQSYK